MIRLHAKLGTRVFLPTDLLREPQKKKAKLKLNLSTMSKLLF